MVIASLLSDGEPSTSNTVRMQVLTFGLLAFDTHLHPTSPKMPINLPPWVLKVVRNGPGHPSTKKSMVPLVVNNGLNTYEKIPFH